MEDYCTANGQTYEWTDEGLRTRHVRPSFVAEPHTGAMVGYAFPWQPGDVMVINNMLMAHGREPFTGKRRTLVAMT